MRLAFLCLTIFFTISSLMASTQDLTLNNIGLPNLKKELAENNNPRPLKKDPLLTKMLDEEGKDDPMVIRPRIEYDDYLRIRSLPNVLGIKLLMNY